MDRSRGSRPALRAPARLRSLGGCGPPPLRSAARARAVPLGAAGRVPGPQGSHPSRSAPSLCFVATKCVRAGAVGPFFRPVAVPPLRRGPCPSAGPAAACAPAPASRLGSVVFSLASLALAGPRPFPPAPSRGASRLRLPGPFALPSSGFGRPSAPVRAPCSVALPLLRLACCQRAGRRVPPWPSLRASGPGCSRPGALPGCRPAFSAPAPGRWLRGRPGCLAGVSCGLRAAPSRLAGLLLPRLRRPKKTRC